MQHVAIDLGSKESQICIRRSDGTVCEERKYPTRKLMELVTTWEPSRVVMETSAEAFRIADAAIAAGHQVRVVPGTLVRLLGVGERGVKNDQRRGHPTGVDVVNDAAFVAAVLIRRSAPCGWSRLEQPARPRRDGACGDRTR